MTNWTREIAEACRIAKVAGARVLEFYNSEFEVDYKTGTDPVTTADRAANALIVEALREAFPNDGIVAEEGDDHSDAMKPGRCWYIDPIDGTREFVARNEEFAVMIGLAVDGEAKVGAVYQPVLDRLYAGAEHYGAYLQHGPETTPLHVSDTATTTSLRLVSSRSHRSDHIEQLCNQLGITERSQVGSVGLKTGWIAERRADLYVHFSNKSSAWDVCAPEAILRAAGGRITDLGGAPFRYGGDDLRNRRGIVACNATAFEEVLPAVQRIATEAGLLHQDD